MQSVQELFLKELRDTYDAEQQALEAMPQLVEAVSNPELRAALEQHMQETQEQVNRLEQLFEQMGESPEGEPCEGMQGLVEEAQELLEEQDEADPAVFDAAVIAAAQKMEHYEIAAYGTLATFAEMMGNKEAKKLLGQTLEEEKTADEKLTRLAERVINRQAMDS